MIKSLEGAEEDWRSRSDPLRMWGDGDKEAVAEGPDGKNIAHDQKQLFCSLWTCGHLLALAPSGLIGRQLGRCQCLGSWPSNASSSKTHHFTSLWPIPPLKKDILSQRCSENLEN